eukprot:NODE_558_length_1545_cov_379.207888_g419_i0.p1 GENE.NODE_558_length_1545_cov_379.207888_g419_i0~~NODE_558_length_1545_cov_379.207888_g419_i0.p1  ORF type:complete len:474 (-),score=149.91 NODE_558_length_1545_cov_379.207888_g419_i0:122-1498(-)
MARPLVSVQNERRNIPLPRVFSAPLRYDVVQRVHTNMNKNSRKPHGVMRRAGHQTSAESWGTGRAVARIPRVGGGGTHRSGQGAFGNMCRGGTMFAPKKTYRKLQVKTNVSERRMAVRAALAASAVPALVVARGHNLNDVPEIPLVVPNSVEALEKTKDGMKFLKSIGAHHDVAKVANTKKRRHTKGKWRNRRYVLRKGPLVVVSKRCKAQMAFRNIPGVEVDKVSALNLLRLAPGGHVGRFIIWTEDAFNDLDKRLKIPNRLEHLPDSMRVINSAEVQGVCRAKRHKQKKVKRNAPRKLLNPAFPIERRKQIVRQAIATKNNRSRTFRRNKAAASKKAKWMLTMKAMGKMTKKGVFKEPREDKRGPRLAEKKKAREARKAKWIKDGKPKEEKKPTKGWKASKAKRASKPKKTRDAKKQKRNSEIAAKISKGIKTGAELRKARKADWAKKNAKKTSKK